MAEKQKMPIRWGSVGFSLNADCEGNNVALIMGYPQSSVFSQTIYTYIPSIVNKIQNGEELADSFKKRLLDTGLFQAAGNEMKYVIKQKPTEEQTQALIKIIIDFEGQIRNNGLVE